MNELIDNYGNRFCIHYYLNNGSHDIDAILQNRCEYEYIGLLKEIAKLLNVEIQIETSPFENGGLKRWFKIAIKRENRKTTLTTAGISMLLSVLFVTPFGHFTEKMIDKLFEDPQMNLMQKEKLQLEIEKLKIDLKKDSAEMLQNNIIRKKRSNFYEYANKEINLYQVSYVIADDQFKFASDEIIVSRSEFGKFILGTDDLDPEMIENATIEIIAPVLKKGKYKWLGLYNNAPISFCMNSVEFRQSVQSGSIEFKNGSTINGLLQIRKKIDSEGLELITGYDVIRVDFYTEDSIQKETKEGLLNKRIKKENKLQVSLFDNKKE